MPNIRKTCALFILLLSIQLCAYSQKADEEVIQKVVATEVQGFLDASSQLAQQWHVTPKSMLMVSYIGSKQTWSWQVQGEELQQWLLQEKNKKAVTKLSQTNHQIRIVGRVAWVTYDQKLEYADGQIELSHELKLLEKIKGKWKIVLGSAHFYPPK